MHYVIIGTHAPEICPTANAKTKALLLEVAPQIPKIAEKHGVTIVAGPYANREHATVLIVEAGNAEELDAMISESRLAHWNTVRVIPSMPMAEAMKELSEGDSLF